MDHQRHRRRVDRTSHQQRSDAAAIENAFEVLQGITYDFEEWDDMPYEHQVSFIDDAVGPLHLYDDRNQRARVTQALHHKHVTNAPDDPRFKDYRFVSGDDMVDRLFDPRDDDDLDQD